MFKINIKHTQPAFVNTILFKRYYSVNPNKSLAKILVFPVTSKKSYLLFRYNDSLVNSNSTLVRYENRIVALATKGWNTLQSSEKSYNKKIVYYVNKFLESAPWTEDSLRSIPSSSSLLRQLKISESNQESKSLEEDTKKFMSQLEIQSGEHDDQLVDIPVYYPASNLTVDELKSGLTETVKTGISYHTRQMLITGALVPLTLPFALVPVVPNIPCFYFAYRFYCNFKAYLGANHLKDLIEQDHIIFKESGKLDAVFNKVKDEPLKLNEEIIDEVIKLYNIETSRVSFQKTLNQERSKLEKSKKD